MIKLFKTNIKLKQNMTPILAMVTIFTLTITIFRPIIINLGKIQQENQAAKNRLDKLTQKTNFLQSLDNTILEQETKKLEEVFPSEKPILNLLVSLTKLAQEEGIIFGGLKLNPGIINNPQEKTEINSQKKELNPDEVGLQEFNINFSIFGKLANIISFISKLEKTAPLMKIIDISLSLEGGNAGMGVNVYYQAIPKSLGKIDEPVAQISAEEQEILNEIAQYRRAEIVKETALTGKQDLFKFGQE